MPDQDILRTFLHIAVLNIMIFYIIFKLKTREEEHGVISVSSVIANDIDLSLRHLLRCQKNYLFSLAGRKNDGSKRKKGDSFRAIKD